MITIDIKQETARVRSHLKRAQEAGTPATLTIEQWLAKIEQFHGLCAYCKEKPFDTLEHLIPISDNGGTTEENCFPSCQRCNFTKGSKGHKLNVRVRQTVYLEAGNDEWIRDYINTERKRLGRRVEISDVVNEALQKLRESVED